MTLRDKNAGITNSVELLFIFFLVMVQNFPMSPLSNIPILKLPYNLCLRPLGYGVPLLCLLFCSLISSGWAYSQENAENPAANTKGNSIVTPYKHGVLFQQIRCISEQLTIAYTEKGNGPKTLLFIHGLASNLPVWDQLIDELSAVYRCIALDLPGYGQSSQSANVSLSHYARCIKTFADSLHLTNLTVVGHSLGGQIAVFMALQHPVLVQNLVLLSPSGFESFNKRDKAFIAMFYTPQFLKSKTDEIVKSDYERGFYSFPENASFLINDRIALKNTSEFHEYCVVNSRCVQSAVKETIIEKLGGIRQPTFIIFGEEDNMIPSSLLHPHLTTKTIAEFARKKIKGSSLLLIPECGHFVQMEKTTIVKKAIVEFVK